MVKLAKFFKRQLDVNSALLRIKTFEADGNVVGLMGELANPLEGGRYSIVRGHAAMALGRLGDPRVVPRLIELAKDDSDTVRMAALGALGLLGDQQAAGALIDALDDPAPLPRVQAVESLGQLGVLAATPRLRVIAESDPDPEMRLYAVEALVALGDVSVIGLIPGVLAAIPARTRRMERWQRLVDRSDPS
jgi:HEAT repeat protein